MRALASGVLLLGACVLTSPLQAHDLITAEAAERFVRRYPTHPDLEEAQFVLLVQYVRAARAASDTAARDAYAGKAREAAQAFARRYPDSMRAAAVPVLVEGLPAGSGR